MPIQLTEQSKGLVHKMIMDEFNKIDPKLEYIHNRTGGLIDLAKQLGLDKTVEEINLFKE